MRGGRRRREELGPETPKATRQELSKNSGVPRVPQVPEMRQEVRQEIEIRSIIEPILI